MSLLAAVFETVGVASILPFMALVLDPSAIQRYHTLQSIAQMVGVTSPKGALLVLGAATVGIVALGNAASAINLFVQQRFSAHTQTRLLATLLRGYLAQPYAFHVERDGPSLMKVLTIDIGAVMAGVISPFMLGLGRLLTAFGVLSILFIQDAKASLLVAVVFGASYLGVYRLVRTRQQKLGLQYNSSILERQRVSQESIGGVKELQVLGRERYAAERFEAAAGLAAYAHASNVATSQIPRLVMETLAFGGILIVTMALVASGTRAAKELVPLLALYAFAGYRLMPALQQVFASALEIRFRLPTLLGVYADYVRGLEAEREWSATETLGEPAIEFNRAIQFAEVTLTYRGAVRPAVRDLTVDFRPNESVGIIGSTGAGKTSVAELALGVHVPTSGTVSVDGIPLRGAAIRAWRRRVGYVPQRIFLSNASVSENIGFGLRPSEINAEAVLRAARLAHADRFIHDLPHGFDTVVGERGVKLSGGQLQRIGIARALYHEPDVLVFDEATSALDGLTEESVMEAIRTLRGKHTVIVIAHRLRTVEACDRIIMMQDGRVVADGSYVGLRETSPEFRRFVGESTLASAAAD